MKGLETNILNSKMCSVFPKDKNELENVESQKILMTKPVVQKIELEKFWFVCVWTAPNTIYEE